MHNQSLTGLNILRFSADVVISRQILSCYIPEFPGDNAEEPPVISLKKKINFIDISYKKKNLYRYETSKFKYGRAWEERKVCRII